MRFPSTKIQIRFKSLLSRQKQNPELKQEAAESPSGFKETDSVTDALDNLTQAKDESLANDENSSNSAKFRKKFPSPGASDENSELKPPYSYAQLIIQVNNIILQARGLDWSGLQLGINPDWIGNCQLIGQIFPIG